MYSCIQNLDLVSGLHYQPVLLMNKIRKNKLYGKFLLPVVWFLFVFFSGKNWEMHIILQKVLSSIFYLFSTQTIACRYGNMVVILFKMLNGTMYWKKNDKLSQ